MGPAGTCNFPRAGDASLILQLVTPRGSPLRGLQVQHFSKLMVTLSSGSEGLESHPRSTEDCNQIEVDAGEKLPTNTESCHK